MEEGGFSEVPKVNPSLDDSVNASEENIACNGQEKLKKKREMQSEQFESHTEDVPGRDLLELLVVYQMDSMGFRRRDYEKYLLPQIADKYEYEQKYRFHKISSEIVEEIVFLMDSHPQTAHVITPRFEGPNRRFSSLYAAIKTLPLWSGRRDRHSPQGEHAHSENRHHGQNNSEQAENMKEMPQLDEVGPARSSQQIANSENLGAPSASQQIMCSICYCMCASWSVDERCHHPFCNICMSSYIVELINVGNYTIKCPEQSCETILADEHIAALIKPDQYDRLIYFRDKTQKENNPDNKFCAKPDCGEVLMLESGDRYSCGKCKALFCAVCMQNWHEGRCDQALKNAIELTYTKLNIKKCPNCNAPIEKSQGCNHMSCKKCNKEFCWLCLGFYSKYHYKYYNCFGCPGMQFEGEGSIAKERLKQILFFLLLPILLAICLSVFFIAIPFYMIACIFGKTCAWAKNEDKCESAFVGILCCWLPQCFRFIVRWVLLLPRGVLYGLFVAPVLLGISFLISLAQIFD